MSQCDETEGIVAVTSSNDSAHTRGQIGIEAGTDVVATNARAWSL